MSTKRVGFLELFFDLVFVFAVTQLVALLHQDHSAGGWARAALVLWLVWWAWSQYTWAGNAVDLDRRTTRLWVLAATGAMLAAAINIPDVFDTAGDGLAFACWYAAVRLIGLGLYWVGLRDDPDHQAALRTYLPIQLLSPLLVVAGGVADDGWRVALWTAAIVVDVISVATAGRGEFRVDPAHFAERHGLIVIIALGESVVATGITASELGTGREVMTVVAIAFVAVAALWWCYFDWVHAAAEARLAGEPDHRRRSNLARDLFTLGHLPIVAGTVVFAAAVEEALAHPDETLDSFGVTALALGPGLYLAGFVAGNFRATGHLPVTRTAGLLVLVGAAVIAGEGMSATSALAVVTAVLVAIAAVETRARAQRPADEPVLV
ncbi:MAG: low temperature requirement protein A [Acidobacteriota bacterium]